MKRAGSAILILLLALQAFYPLVLYSVYYANKSYIASVLCENKDAPQLKCKGKCYLKKQLKKAEEQEHRNGPATEKYEVLTYLPSKDVTPLLPVAFPPVRHFTPLGDDHYLFDYHAALFKPPRA